MRRIDGEVERQQHDRDPAEPCAACCLEGEGGRDPVQADDELADAERPADEQPAPQRLRAADAARTSTAKATGSSGHQSTGANANAETAPVRKA